MAHIDVECVCNADKRADAYVDGGVLDFGDVRLRRPGHERKLTLGKILSFSLSFHRFAKLYSHTLHVHGASVFPN